MTDKNLVTFPRRKFSHPAAASQFASDAFQAMLPRMEKAMLAGDRIGLEVVIDIYERDIVPNSAWFYGHLAYALCMFGERLRDSDLVGRGISLYKRILADEFPGAPATERHKANQRGWIGRALIVRGELDVSTGYYHEAVTWFETALKSWPACLQVECVQLSVGLGLAHLALAETEKDRSRLAAAGIAISQAVEFNATKGGVLWGDLRYSEAKLALLRAQAGQAVDLNAGIKAAEDAIALYRSWQPRYVIMPTWETRSVALRDALAALAQ